MYAEDEPAKRRNEDVINNLLGELYATEGKGCIHKLHI